MYPADRFNESNGDAITHKLLIAVALILIWSSIAGAQEFTIHGNVTAPSKKPIGSYDVSLNYRNTDQIAAHSVVGRQAFE